MTKKFHGDADLAVEAALRTQPLLPAPITLRPSVMKRIRAITPLPHFGLTWLDYAMSLFGGGMALTPFFVWQFITPQMMLNLQIQMYILSQRFSPSFLLPVLMNR